MRLLCNAYIRYSYELFYECNPKIHTHNYNVTQIFNILLLINSYALSHYYFYQYSSNLHYAKLYDVILAKL